MNIYAVIRSGGKQYRIAPGDVIRVEKLDAGSGETVELDTICLLVTGQEVHVGHPVVEGARIRAHVLEEGRGEKILVFKKRRRKGYRKTAGHRQYFTALRISEILFNGAVFRSPEESPKRAREKTTEETVPVRTKKDEAARKSKEKKRPESKSASASAKKTDSEKARPSRPAEQPDAGSGLTVAPASVEPAPSGAGDAAVEQKIARTEERQDARPSEAFASPSQEQSPALPAGQEEVGSSPVLSGIPDKTPEKLTASNRRRTAVAVAAVLLLLAIILLLWGRSPFIRTQSTVAPVPMTVQPVQNAPKKADLPVPEKVIEDTTPVDKPSAPAQPPD